MTPDAFEIRDTVRNGYAAVATGAESGCCSGSSCCGTTPPAVDLYAQILGYAAEDLATLPEGANLGLSCGNPIVLATLQEGQMVMDLGSGAGFDVFLAAKRVGATGHVIGVDMTPEMISKARKNAREFTKRTGLNNVEFRLGEIEHLPAADNSVDVVISNCVINLSPEKPRVWREIARVLKPGGKVAVSDIALLKPLPPQVRTMTEALVGCIAGAVLISETEQMIAAAGLTVNSIKTSAAFLDAVMDTSPDGYREIIEKLPEGESLHDYVCSMSVTAFKPSVHRCCC